MNSILTNSLKWIHLAQLICTPDDVTEYVHLRHFMEKPMPLIAKVVPLLHYFKNLCHRLVAEVLQKDIFLEYFEKVVYYAAAGLYHFSLKQLQC